MALCAAAALGFLSGCASSYQPAKAVPLVAPGPKNYGIWFTADCRLSAARADLTLSTDGRLSHDTLRFVVTSGPALAAPPEIVVWGVGGFDLNIEGRDRTFSFELPYGPREVADMMNDKVFLVFSYKPAGADRALKAVFPARELPEAITELANGCLPPKK